MPITVQFQSLPTAPRTAACGSTPGQAMEGIDSISPCTFSQRRQDQRKRLNLERYETASESSDDGAGAGGAAAAKRRGQVLAVYDSGGVTTTVTTIAMHSDRCSQHMSPCQCETHMLPSLLNMDAVQV